MVGFLGPTGPARPPPCAHPARPGHPHRRHRQGSTAGRIGNWPIPSATSARCWASSFHPGRSARNHLRVVATAAGLPLSGRCRPRPGWPGPGGPSAGRWLLARHAPTPGLGDRPARRPPGADPGRAGQRPGPRRRPLAARAPAPAGRPGPHRAGLQPRPGRGRPDRRPGGDHRQWAAGHPVHPGRPDRHRPAGPGRTPKPRPCGRCWPPKASRPTPMGPTSCSRSAPPPRRSARPRPRPGSSSTRWAPSAPTSKTSSSSSPATKEPDHDPSHPRRVHQAATTRLIYGLTAAMAAFAVLTVAANILDRQGDPTAVGRQPPCARRRPGDAAVGRRPAAGHPGHGREFRHQTVTQTFLVTPDRGQVVAAKLVAYPLAGIALALTILAFTAAVAPAGWPPRGSRHRCPSRSSARPGAAGAVLAAGLCALVGVGVRPPGPQPGGGPGRRGGLGPAGRGPAHEACTPPAWPSGCPRRLRPPSPTRAAASSRWPEACCWPATRWRWRWPAPAWSSAATSPDRHRPGAARSRERRPANSKEDEHRAIAQDLENGRRHAVAGGAGHHAPQPPPVQGPGPPAGPLLQAGRRLPAQDVCQGRLLPPARSAGSWAGCWPSSPGRPPP